MTDRRDTTADALAAHVRECEECRTVPLPAERVAVALSRSVPDIDPAVLSQRALTQLRPVLRRQASVAFWKRLAAGIGLSLLPLPAVLAYDAYVLRGLFWVVSSILPQTVAAYLVLTYAAFLLLLFSSTYAVIPLVLVRRMPRSAAG